MIIVVGGDDGYAMPMAVTLYSALANMETGRAVSLYILDGGISEQNRRKLTDVLNVTRLEVHIEWVKPDLSQLEGLANYSYTWITQAAYLRLLIPELLPTECQRAIYLDSDVVVERDLGQLWKQPIEAFPALAVANYHPPFVGCRKDENHLFSGLAPETVYCNTGVMVMNLKRWHVEKIGPRALELARKFQLSEGDQEALNVVIAGAWGLLDPKWNVQLSGVDEYAHILKQFSYVSDLQMQQTRDELLREPYIRHFTARFKPWHFAYKEPARLRFFHYLRQSRWFGDVEDINELMALTWKEANEHDPLMKQLYFAKQVLDALIPLGDTFIMVDECKWHPGVAGPWEGWYAIPFLERDGKCWGPPSNDETGIREVERLRQSGANFTVFLWPAFWWLEYYSRLHAYLCTHFTCVLKNERLVVFDLRS